ncbi:MAG: hypothetical protein IJ060_09320 [Oscillospiraceae bacterium]|nr:hypothetical protein [Oscillospiraceae bacterium]
MYNFEDIDSSKDIAAVIAAIESDSRTFRTLLEFSENDRISGREVGKWTMTHASTNDDTITIGDVLARQLEISVYSRRMIRRGEKFRLKVYLLDSSRQTGWWRAKLWMVAKWQLIDLSAMTLEQVAHTNTVDADGAAMSDIYITLGEFTAAKCQRDGEAQKITAYDRLAFSDIVYQPHIPFPALSGNVMTDVLKQCGVRERIVADVAPLATSDGAAFCCADGKPFYCSGEYSFVVQQKPVGQTCRDVLRQLTAVQGRNGILTREGKFTTVGIADSVPVTELRQSAIDRIEQSDSTVQIAGIVCDTGSGTLQIGDVNSDYTVEIESPYMTETRLLELWMTMREYCWTPAECSEKLADPRRDLFDQLTYNGLQFPVTSLSLEFDGGLYGSSDACGQIEVNEDFAGDEQEIAAGVFLATSEGEYLVTEDETYICAEEW